MNRIRVGKKVHPCPTWSTSSTFGSLHMHVFSQERRTRFPIQGVHVLGWRSCDQEHLQNSAVPRLTHCDFGQHDCTREQSREKCLDCGVLKQAWIRNITSNSWIFFCPTASAFNRVKQKTTHHDLPECPSFVRVFCGSLKTKARSRHAKHRHRRHESMEVECLKKKSRLRAHPLP